MIVSGLNGKLYRLKLNPRISKEKSGPHLKCRQIIRELYPHTLLYEEISLPGSNKPSLKVDFYLPEFSLMIEVQGEQHRAYNEHFHKNIMGFFNSKRRDLNKRKWCELNQIKLLELYDGDWAEQLRNTVEGTRERTG